VAAAHTSVEANVKIATKHRMRFSLWPGGFAPGYLQYGTRRPVVSGRDDHYKGTKDTGGKGTGCLVASRIQISAAIFSPSSSTNRGRPAWSSKVVAGSIPNT